MMRPLGIARWATCAALAGTLLTSCGGGGDDDATDDETAATPTTVASPPTTAAAPPPTEASAVTGATTTAPTAASTGPEVSPTDVTPGDDGDQADGDCPLVSSAELTTILGTDVALAPDGVQTDPAGVTGTSCGFVNADTTVVVSTLLYDEPPPGLLDAEIANLDDNDVSYEDVDDLGSRAIASGSGGTVNVTAEGDGWYLVMSLVSPSENGGDPFTPDAGALARAVAAARAIVE
jgi:hypothetical protein